MLEGLVNIVFELTPFGINEIHGKGLGADLNLNSH